jgi:hemerythrin-like domain-containing protein
MASVTLHKTLPGFMSPAVGFEAPFDILEACHERVERMLVLLQRLCQHVQDTGCDEQARQAARDVMRYFDMAAPLHHQDEELHVFPAVRCGPYPGAAEAVHRLLAQHRQMEIGWAGMREVLLTLIAFDAQEGGTFNGLRSAEVDAFVQAYRSHIRLEEDLVYPAAQRQLNESQLRAMGEEMMVRRGVVRIAKDQ